ncbi:fumarylacetoacetate hydrolase family protein [Nocardia sp. JMUB6875]
MVELLLGAYRDHVPIDPVVTLAADLDIEDAYAIQQAQVATWTAAGDTVRGHKVGLTSAAIQRQLGVDQPDFGHLTASMFYLEHQPIPVDRFLQPRVEPEIAFVLARPLHGPGVTVADAVRAVDFVVPALEIIDSRIRDWDITIVDTIADNASSGGLVLGHRPRRLTDVDLTLAGAALHRNGEVVGTGAGGAILGSPLNSLVWLANTLSRFGAWLAEGDVIIPGAMTAAVPVAAGDTVVCSVAGLGRVTAVFAGAGSPG